MTTTPRPGSKVPLRGRLLVVGKGPPDRGGIAAFLSLFLSSEAATSRQARFLNLAHDRQRQGGKLSVANLARTVRDVRAIWREAAECDLVHIHSALAPAVTLVRAGLLALAARLRGCRVIVHGHGGRVQLWLTTRPRRLLVRIGLVGAARVVAVAEEGCAALRAVLGAERVVLVNNGVDLEQFSPPLGKPSHDPPRVLYVGLLTPRKGVIDLVEASTILRGRGVLHELWLAGGSPDEGPTAEAQVRTALGPEVRLLGVRAHDEMPVLYREADVFCLPSWWEAFPLSVLEAMASGLPVVASAVGDVGRIVEDGSSGLLVPPRDPRELAAALETLLTDATRRAAMGAAGRHRVERSFSITSTLAAIEAIYAELEGRESLRSIIRSIIRSFRESVRGS